ncbi:hypothetical protein CRE_09527 [Caenorhabditis remanei]|uniref:Uncharacterized protein n=1 Tax=Caenorhabditis remanei TaxID=31234 RepID=E3MJA7_CAERE|nr:hypothetical protein CRE_09527 [Caenorhabditis remanei]
MPITGLQYDSLRTVLQYIEANKRFCLSQRLPAIRFAEKAVPLKIDYLQFDDFGVTVNKTSYSLAVYRDFHQGSDYFQKEKDEDGIQFDLDQYGFQLQMNKTDLVPGEVIFGGVRVENHNFNGNQLHIPITFPWSSQKHDMTMRRCYDKHLELFQIALKTRLDQGNSVRGMEVLNSFPVMTKMFSDDELVRGELTAKELKIKLSYLNCVQTSSLKILSHHLRRCLQPFDCLHNNKPLPFTPLIQLTIKREGQEKQIERYPYTMKLHEAIRKLSWLMFGGRKSVVQVHNFPFIDESITLRIPKGLKIRVRKLRFKENMNGRLEALNNLIDDSSYPLKKFSTLHEREEIDHFAHHALTSAQQIVLEGAAPPNINLLLNLRNKVVHFKYIWSPDFSIEELLTFAQNIIKAGSPVGAQRSFRMSNEVSIKTLLNRVAEQFNLIRSNRGASIRMGNETKLNISYKFAKCCKEDNLQMKNWVLKMTVVPGLSLSSFFEKLKKLKITDGTL